jgi:hypothetical protein
VSTNVHVIDKKRLFIPGIYCPSFAAVLLTSYRFTPGSPSGSTLNCPVIIARLNDSGITAEL